MLTAKERWIAIGGLAIVVMFFLLLSLPDVGSGRPSSRMRCNNNIHNISLALQQYHDVYGTYPPPFVADNNGKPLHSWRVLILPFIEQGNLYRKYRFDEPWDGPNNSKLHDIALSIYCCPARSATQPLIETSYTVVVGPTTVFPGGYSRTADIVDGPSKTILVVEIANSGIHWMEPRDIELAKLPLAINSSAGRCISSPHKDGAHVALASGDVQFLPNSTQARSIQELLTRADRLPINADF